MSVRWSRLLDELHTLGDRLRPSTSRPEVFGGPNPDQWTEWWLSVDRILKALRRDGPELIRRAAEPSMDGFRPVSLGLVGGHPKGGVSRPTEDLVVRKVDAETEGRSLDPVRRSVLRMVADTQTAAGWFRVAAAALGDDPAGVLRYTDMGIRRLVRASSHRALALPPVVLAEPSDGCVHCAKFGVYERTHRGGYCRPCYDHVRHHEGRLPSGEQVRARQWRRVERDATRRAGNR